MFFRYLGRELRRRARSAAVIAVGLAVGVGLVITVSSAAQGVKTAQVQVLHSLYGLGTDITVSQTATPSPGGFHFGGAPASPGSTFAKSLVTSTLGLAAISDQDVTTIEQLKDVKGAVGELGLTSIHFSGSFTPGAGGGFSRGSGSSAGSFNINSTSIDGVDIANPSLGPLSGTTIKSGSYFKSSDANSKVAIVDTTYAKQESLKVGSTVTISSTSYKVVGIASAPSTGSAVDVYLPLAEAQTLSSNSGKVNQIFVEASTSSEISSVKSEIQKALPKVTVTTAQSLASEVTGSLGTASNLASSLGTWLAVVVLVAAFALAALLTLSSVSRRVREFGTLKALGWPSRRIVGQVVGEGLVLGAVGAAVGIGVGFLGAFLVTKLAPPLKATLGAVTGAAAPTGAGTGAFHGFGGGRFGGRGAAAHSVTLHLTAPVQFEALGLAVALAIAGGLVAGLVGGWRVASLRPAEALRRVE